MSALFEFPAKAAFGRALPKEKIYAHTQPNRALRDRFVSQISRIVWQYKLAPETTNLPARPGVPEIQIFDVTLKNGELSEDVLRCIDKAIPFPIFFRLVFDGRIKVISAYKRPSDAGSAKWVVDGYFETDWLPADAERSTLPVALDLAGLYEQMLRQLMPLLPRPAETLKAQVDRLGVIRSKQKDCLKMESRLQTEKQFNRKVEINSQLRNLRKELEELSR
jgi:hypothetical protein